MIQNLKEYKAVTNSSFTYLIEHINRFYVLNGWRVISIVESNGDFWAALERDQE